jgi:hypothetical protein
VSSDAYSSLPRPSLCLLTPCRMPLVLSVRARPCQKRPMRARRPACRAHCPMRAKLADRRILWRPRPGPSNALQKCSMQRWPFLAHADGRRRQHRPQTHSATYAVPPLCPGCSCKRISTNVRICTVSLSSNALRVRTSTLRRILRQTVTKPTVQ